MKANAKVYNSHDMDGSLFEKACFIEHLFGLKGFGTSKFWVRTLGFPYETNLAFSGNLEKAKQFMAELFGQDFEGAEPRIKCVYGSIQSCVFDGKWEDMQSTAEYILPDGVHVRVNVRCWGKGTRIVDFRWGDNMENSATDVWSLWRNPGEGDMSRLSHLEGVCYDPTLLAAMCIIDGARAAIHEQMI